MGFRISWLAVESAAKPRLLAMLGLAETEEPDEANEAPFSIADLASGWSVLWSNDEDFASEERAAALSRELGKVLAVHVNETWMHSTAALYRDGARQWRLHHEGDERIDMLVADGTLPAAAAAIEQRLRAEQAAADADGGGVDFLFDVPLEVARSVCGFKHDVMGDWSFAVAQPGTNGPPQPTGLLGRLFGRR